MNLRASFLFTATLLPLAGCHTLRFRVASPVVQRAPEIRCIVVVQTDKISEEIAEIAMNACKDAIDDGKEIKK